VIAEVHIRYTADYFFSKAIADRKILADIISEIVQERLSVAHLLGMYV